MDLDKLPLRSEQNVFTAPIENRGPFVFTCIEIQHPNKDTELSSSSFTDLEPVEAILKRASSSRQAATLLWNGAIGRGRMPRECAMCLFSLLTLLKAQRKQPDDSWKEGEIASLLFETRLVLARLLREYDPDSAATQYAATLSEFVSKTQVENLTKIIDTFAKVTAMDQLAASMTQTWHRSLGHVLIEAGSQRTDAIGIIYLELAWRCLPDNHALQVQIADWLAVLYIDCGQIPLAIAVLVKLSLYCKAAIIAIEAGDDVACERLEKMLTSSINPIAQFILKLSRAVQQRDSSWLLRCSLIWQRVVATSSIDELEAKWIERITKFVTNQ